MPLAVDQDQTQDVLELIWIKDLLLYRSYQNRLWMRLSLKVFQEFKTKMTVSIILCKTIHSSIMRGEIVSQKPTVALTNDLSIKDLWTKYHLKG